MMAKQIFVLAILLLVAGCGDSASKSQSNNGDNSASNASNELLPTLDWVTIDTNGWELTIDNRKMKAWTDKDGDMLSIALFSPPEVDGNGLPEGFPDLAKGVEELRNYRRKTSKDTSKEQKSGLVQADIITLGKNVLASVSITKQRMEPRGFEFTGVCFIPRRDFSYLIFVCSKETGTTGIREALVSKELLESGQLKFEPPTDGKPGRLAGFYKDPYDAKFNDGALYNLSDQKKYDKQFPQSPLTRARTKLNKVIGSIVLSPNIGSSQPYTGPSASADSN